jgi:hypothetical protein
MEEIWTKEQVENLKRKQEGSYFQRYACICGEILEPTVSGWKCSFCNRITQTWAHEHDLNGDFIKRKK